jgi:hypothetical protein
LHYSSTACAAQHTSSLTHLDLPALWEGEEAVEDSLVEGCAVRDHDGVKECGCLCVEFFFWGKRRLEVADE